MITALKRFYWRGLEWVSLLKDDRKFLVREISSGDREQIKKLVEKGWGSATTVYQGKAHVCHEFPGFLAYSGNKILGYICYSIEKGQCEIVVLESLKRKIGIGQTLVKYVKNSAEKHGCKRFWVITTNDNTYALKFYQKIGFHLVAVYRNAVEENRKVKPQISFIGHDGIPSRDEIELEIVL